MLVFAFSSFVEHVLALTDSRGADALAQGALGLSSELAELELALFRHSGAPEPFRAETRRDVVLEAGDGWFYLALIASALPDPAEIVVECVSGNSLPTFTGSLGAGMSHATRELSGIAEKVRFQGHPLDKYHDDIVRLCSLIAWRLAHLFDPETAWRENVAKLEKRYPAGFSPAASLARADVNN